MESSIHLMSSQRQPNGLCAVNSEDIRVHKRKQYVCLHMCGHRINDACVRRSSLSKSIELPSISDLLPENDYHLIKNEKRPRKPPMLWTHFGVMFVCVVIFDHARRSALSSVSDDDILVNISHMSKQWFKLINSHEYFLQMSRNYFLFLNTCWIWFQAIDSF